MPQSKKKSSLKKNPTLLNLINIHTTLSCILNSSTLNTTSPIPPPNITTTTPNLTLTPPANTTDYSEIFEKIRSLLPPSSTSTSPSFSPSLAVPITSFCPSPLPPSPTFSPITPSPNSTSPPLHKRKLDEYLKKCKEDSKRTKKTHSKKSKSKCINILSTGLTPHQNNAVRSTCSKLGGQLSLHFTSKVTHIIIPSDNRGLTPHRTLKYMMGVLQGLWIVSYDWVKESEKAGKWVYEEDWEIQGDPVGQGGPKKARETFESNGPRLFSDMKFYLCGHFKSPKKVN
eukprot:TRINITY_DN1901_c0_g1_i1.p1 TRINITY_DN1901_c0_g1~~TRINITY_DN1901_c0_g1_i1.p1  ORF type:complete len:285 (-),score=42.12 TRINITY_DN1901_c0_g1_i1:104-958(-)